MLGDRNVPEELSEFNSDVQLGYLARAPVPTADIHERFGLCAQTFATYPPI